MKLTENRLRQIIKEEAQKLQLNESSRASLDDVASWLETEKLNNASEYERGVLLLEFRDFEVELKVKNATVHV